MPGIESRDLKPVPLIAPPLENVEDAQVDQWASTIVDGLPIVVENALQLIKRPGLLAWIDLGTNLPIDGLYWWDKQRVVLAVSGGRVWKILDSAGTKQEITGSTEIRSSQLVSFANTDTTCVMANGGRMVHTDLTSLTPGRAPRTSTVTVAMAPAAMDPTVTVTSPVKDKARSTSLWKYSLARNSSSSEVAGCCRIFCAI